MRFFKFAVPATVALTGLVLSLTTATYAKPEFSKETKKPCTTCHVKMGSKDLNDTGKYYKEHKSLPK